jgi:hypothetical protein
MQDQQAALYEALAKAQAAFGQIAKNREVTITQRSGAAFSFRYADLEEITSKTRKALSENGLSILQPIVTRDGVSYLQTMLVHSGGGTITSETQLPPIAGDIKQYGAAITYLRRYAKTAMLDIAADDDLDEQDSGYIKQDNTPKGPTPYPDADFEKHFPKWVSAIQSGRTTMQDLIKTVSSKGVLSQNQLDRITSIQVGAAE